MKTSSLEFTQPDEPPVVATLRNSPLQSSAVAVYEQTGNNALNWSQECVEQHHLLIPQVIESETNMIEASTEAQYQLFLKKCRLNSSSQDIEKIAKWLVDFLALAEEIIDAVSIQYQNRPAFLILSNKRVICLSLSNSYQEVRIGFVLQLKGIEQVDVSEQGLEIRRNNIKVKFDDKQLAKQFVDKNLSHFVTVKTQKRSPWLGFWHASASQ